jgi:hypothetical protein
MKIWILLVQSDFQAVGRPFSFDVESSDSVEDMKLGVKQHVKILANVDLLKLAVWKTRQNDSQRMRKMGDDTQGLGHRCQ